MNTITAASHSLQHLLLWHIMKCSNKEEQQQQLNAAAGWARAVHSMNVPLPAASGPGSTTGPLCALIPKLSAFGVDLKDLQVKG